MVRYIPVKNKYIQFSTNCLAGRIRCGRVLFLNSDEDYQTAVSSTASCGKFRRTPESHSPAAIVQFKKHHVENIKECMLYAHSTAKPISVCGGGHTENSAGSGSVMIDLRYGGCRGVDFVQDEEFGAVVVAQGGANLSDISRVAAEHGYIVPLGTAPTVGAGALLYGGVGHLTRNFGLSVNSILRMSIITPTNGDQKSNCSPTPTLHQLSLSTAKEQQQKLFFAACGSGPSLGVVVELTLRAFKDVGLWSVYHDYFQSSSTSQTEMILEAYVATTNTKQMEDNLLMSSDLYIERIPGIGIGIVGIDKQKVIASISHFGPTKTSTFNRVALNTCAALSTTSKHTVSVPWQDLFEHEAYLSSNMVTHVHQQEKKNWSVHVRSIFVRYLTQDHLSYLSERLMHSTDAPTSFSTLHVQHGGSSVHDVNADANDEQEVKCAGDVKKWKYSVVVSCWYNEDHNTDRVKNWVNETIEHLLQDQEQSVCVYPTDMGPEDCGNNLIQDAFVNDNVRKRLHTEKMQYDPNNMMFYSFPVGSLVLL